MPASAESKIINF